MICILYLERLTLLGGVKDDFFEIILFSKILSKLFPIIEKKKLLLPTNRFRQCRSTPTSAPPPPPPKVSARAPAHRSYHFRGVKLKSCIKKIHHNLYISKQANVRIKHADTESSSQKKFGTDARVQ